MSGQWEQYVEKAAVSLDPAAFDKTIENHDGLIRKFRRERATELAQGVLAVVGPLIAEDTRTRMVEAAAAAVKREGGAVAVTVEDEVDRKYEFNGDEADEVWVDRP